MKKSDLIAKVKICAGLESNKKAEWALNAILREVCQSLKDGETISLRGVGTFKVVVRKQRMGRNPRTGEQIVLPEYKAIKFVMSSTLRKEL